MIYSQNNSNFLTNYWPLGDSLKDLVGGKNLSIKLNGAVTADRFGIVNSALAFNQGYGQFPIGFYFNSKRFTFMIWVKTLSFVYYQRIVEFGKTYPEDTVNAFYTETSGAIGTGTSISAPSYKFCKDNIENGVKLNEWFHLAVVSESSTVRLYINEKEVCSFNGPIRDVEREFNYIGKSFGETYPKVVAVFDEFKIFNKALTLKEIVDEKEKVPIVRFGQLMFIRFSERFLNGLKHYWPMAGSTGDIIGGQDMRIIQNGNLVDDRFGNQKSGKRSPLLLTS